MSLLRFTPCHLCEHNYPEFLQREWHGYYYCPFDYSRVRRHGLIPFLSSYSTSSKFENALWIYEVKHRLKLNGCPAIIRTSYEEFGNEVKSIFELQILANTDPEKIKPEFFNPGPSLT